MSLICVVCTHVIKADSDVSRLRLIRQLTNAHVVIFVLRDPDELQRPVSANAPVRRFFRYVQAAKDGQDQKDCLRLYPACSINTEP
jgi:hypothetical protein